VSLLLVRHGRTDHNAAGRLLGRLDPALDDVGQAQAAALAAEVARLVPGATVVSSPLRRARETAALVADALGAEVALDDRWTELDYGELDGRPLSSVPADLWATWRADATYRPPGGESLVDLRIRLAPALDELSGRADRTDVVVVSHVSPIKAAVTWALGVPDDVTWRLYLAPASITELRWGPPGVALAGFNHTAHLDR
jgi:probable phosphoglycerate mutase